MDKVLGQDLNKMERIQFLKDNCNKVEDLGYVKQISQEEIEEIKDMLVEKSIQLRDIRADKKEANRMWNEQIKQLNRETEDATDKLKNRSQYVTEPCYKFVDFDTRETGYYNAEGLLVYSRPARQEELQMDIYQRDLKTGTNN